jgi:hypothetical protein
MELAFVSHPTQLIIFYEISIISLVEVTALSFLIRASLKT